jgi:hypothetical protein
MNHFMYFTTLKKNNHTHMHMHKYMHIYIYIIQNCFMTTTMHCTVFSKIVYPQGNKDKVLDFMCFN